MFLRGNPDPELIELAKRVRLEALRRLRRLGKPPKGTPIEAGWQPKIRGRWPGKKLVPEGFLLPRGYGVAWPKSEAPIAVCYPIPLNLLLGGIRKVWHAAKRGLNPTETDRQQMEIAILKAHRGRLEAENRVLRDWIENWKRDHVGE